MLSTDLRYEMIRTHIGDVRALADEVLRDDSARLAAMSFRISSRDGDWAHTTVVKVARAARANMQVKRRLIYLLLFRW